jgi:four helix bundle protein
MPEGLEGLRIYQMAEDLADAVWHEIVRWKPFPRDTLGRQFVDAADSVGGNIAEGYGRYHYRDNRQFQYYARGSLFETRPWLRRAHERDLLSDERFEELAGRVEALAPQLNTYIRMLGRRSKNGGSKRQVSEGP